MKLATHPTLSAKVKQEYKNTPTSHMPFWNLQHHIAFTSQLGKLPAGRPSEQTFIVDGIIYNYVQGILTM
jgi:hypothetical protein